MTSATHFLKQLNEEKWNSSIKEGKWTLRDVVSHMMLWDKYFYEEAIAKVASGDSVTLKHLDFDDFNCNAIHYGGTISTHQLIEKTILYREKIIQDVRMMSEKTVNKNYLDGDGNVFHVPQYMQDFIWHDQHHINQIKEFLKTKEE